MSAGATSESLYPPESEGPSFALVIGTYAALPYVHLQLESRLRNYPDVPVLVHDDASPAGDDLRALCAGYGAQFSANGQHMPVWIGDLSAFAAGFRWARSLGVEILIKMSRRFIPLHDWRPGLCGLAQRTQYATFSNHTVTGELDYRTECVAMHVASWDAAGAIARIEERVAERSSTQVEGFLHGLARDVHQSACQANRRYEAAHPKEERFSGYGDWDLLGTDRTQPICHSLWHHSCRPVEYARAALQYGVTAYSLDEWRRPNDHRPSALWESPDARQTGARLIVRGRASSGGDAGGVAEG